MRLPRVLTVLCAVIVLISIVAFSKDTAASSRLVDVSWPNCNIQTPSQYNTAIVGVTGGLSFHPNPCLAREFSWFNYTGLYINTGYPGNSYAEKYRFFPRSCSRRDSQCLAYNYGYNEGLYAIKYANLQDAHSSSWWVDVETDNSWTLSQKVNRSSISGTIAALKNNIYLAHIGIYSSPDQWSELTGSWQNHLPTWVATGATDFSSGRTACQLPSFSGGTNKLSQYTQSLDVDIYCAPDRGLQL